jgi:hypothetical protein
MFVVGIVVRVILTIGKIAIAQPNVNSLQVLHVVLTGGHIAEMRSTLLVDLLGDFLCIIWLHRPVSKVCGFAFVG